jgi:hypothetical protein
MTECTQESFEFAAHFSRRVVAEFNADRLTTDGGSPLLRQVDWRIGLLRRFAECFLDRRDPLRIEHSVAEMVAQRVYAMALGYEDLNDHEQLRHDPLLALLAGKRELDSPLAGKSTLNRLELSRADEGLTRYHKISYSSEKIDHLLVDLFLESHTRRPRRIVLDLDSTDIPLHGHQERRFFHGYYNSYCYLPLYIFTGDHLLCARLRPADQDGAAGAVSEVGRIVSQIRQRWPQVEIVVRADSGFCREELMNWCEGNQVDYIVGLARNERLRKLLAQPMREARQQYETTGRAARVFTEFRYRTHKSWSHWRRVIAKAEYIPGKENPRFVVTSLAGGDAQPLYEKFYCARGEMENRIKEQLCLFADRLSTETMRANQLRLYLSAMAYTLLEALRRLALRGTEWAEAQVDTIRLRLLKIAAQLQISARRIRLRYSAAYPWKPLFAHAWQALRC